MNKKVLRHFAVCFLFTAVAIIFYSQVNLELSKFLIFFVSGCAVGANLIMGIFKLKNSSK